MVECEHSLPSIEVIDEFASKFSHLTHLQFGLCVSRSPNTEIPVNHYIRIISHIPELTSITIDDYQIVACQDQEHKVLSQGNDSLHRIGFRYSKESFEAWEVTWKPGSPTIEGSRDVRGDICTWTPDPSQRHRWMFWLERFGTPSNTQQAMIERWPDSDMPTLLEMEEFASPYTGSL